MRVKSLLRLRRVGRQSLISFFSHSSLRSLSFHCFILVSSCLWPCIVLNWRFASVLRKSILGFVVFLQIGLWIAYGRLGDTCFESESVSCFIVISCSFGVCILKIMLRGCTLVKFGDIMSPLKLLTFPLERSVKHTHTWVIVSLIRRELELEQLVWRVHRVAVLIHQLIKIKAQRLHDAQDILLKQTWLLEVQVSKLVMMLIDPTVPNQVVLVILVRL